MSKGTGVIQEALEEIGAHSIAMPAPAETIVNGMNKLNAMMQLWISWGIDIQVVPLKVPGDELSEPIDTRNAIVANLALILAPSQGKVASQELKTNARNGLNMVKTLYQKFTISKTVPSSTLPKGAGNSKGSNRSVFFGPGATLDA